ncbi:MBL fold metallo-hydrolase [Streptacidiphilus sp. ASG 303]|uniref:MBL fold metallo-hydrolase n=1 Tax=Streptacidiphilus sp. ASG 303 TaxID=2896847 RepID=UPI001E5330B5|nr:MBL fold metallo-hydrolase [Streptacidiphilus sp. ASG 303]MCD0481529.1 MBL fold metallo-hydrolase [Streptacidiphilus sp. ASG 303]
MPRTTPPSRLARLLRPAALGGIPTGERLERILASPHHADGTFRNPAAPDIPVPAGGRTELLRSMLRRADRVRRSPAAPVPLHREAPSGPPASGLRLTWLGHSTVLAEIDGARVLFDPVWGERCSPVRFAGPRRLHPVPLPLDGLGPLDAVVISHDHYDHLDMPTVRALAGSGALFAVPLGVGAHLERWGVPAGRIAELDWHESVGAAGLTLTATPARHFCGRGLRRRTLWASWAVAGPRHRVFHSGDTGYFPGFAEIGAAHGPFDATMVQIGAYSEFWPDIHMTPEEGLRAHADLGGGVLLPIHWGTFNLAPHPWDEPAERTLAAAEAAGAEVAVPVPGRPFEPGGELPREPWWRSAAVPAPGAARAGGAAAAPVTAGLEG